MISAANQSVKSFADSLRSGNKEYTSLSRVLKDIQRSELLKAGYAAAFEALGLPSDGSFKPARFFAIMQESQFKTVTVREKGKDPREEQRLGIWGMAQKKDADGKKVFEADGTTPVMEPVLRVVAAWTPNKLFKCIAQAQAIAAQA